jgi:uncharacterized protein YycO
MRLLFTTTRSIPSALIRAIDGGAASHCGIELPSGAVVDSSWAGGGVAQQSRAEFLAADRVLIADVPLHLPDQAQAERWLIAQLGKGYDYTALVGWAFWRDWNDAGSWYCSELAIAAAVAGGRRLAEPPRRIGVRLAHELAVAWAQG